MEIIDAHAHIYPNKIAKKATEAIGDFYNIEMDVSEGTAEKLVLEGEKAGISRYVVHSCATKAQQVRSINEFIKAEMDLHKEFIGFMTLHQDLTEEEIEKEVGWCIENGFKGVKLHPDFQKFYIDDLEVEKIYRVIGNKLPILFHIGDNRYDFSMPERLVKMAKKYPQVNFIAAHFGGYLCWDKVEIYLGLNNVYFDTCSSLEYITPQRAREIITLLGADKFFFATDFPMWKAKEELDRFNKISLTEKEWKMILSENIKKLLKI